MSAADLGGRGDGPAAVVKPPLDDDARQRRAIYALLIAIGLAGLLGRIAAVSSGDGRTPFLSANDRSRWATIRSLVEEGSYEIDVAIADRGWDSIDKVRHAGQDGEPHYYSSKPPLLPTMLAGEYWVIRQVTGRKLSEHPMYIGRIMLAVTNGFFFLLFLWAVAGLAERCGASDWGRISWWPPPASARSWARSPSP